jgi:hypothetical protein
MNHAKNTTSLSGCCAVRASVYGGESATLHHGHHATLLRSRHRHPEVQRSIVGSRPPNDTGLRRRAQDVAWAMRRAPLLRRRVRRRQIEARHPPSTAILAVGDTDAAVPQAQAKTSRERWPARLTGARRGARTGGEAPGTRAARVAAADRTGGGAIAARKGGSELRGRPAIGARAVGARRFGASILDRAVARSNRTATARQRGQADQVHGLGHGGSSHH